MVVGFNHNFRYQGEVYHIQTEDSGKYSPNIVTLLYQGGTILASKKTSYADIAKIDNLEQVVEELMKDQHKNMLRGLKSGEFDEVIERFKAGKKVTPQTSGPAAANEPATIDKPVPQAPKPASEPPPVPPRPAVAPAPPLHAQSSEATPRPAPSPAAEQGPDSAVEVSLDEVILSYLIGDKK